MENLSSFVDVSVEVGPVAYSSHRDIRQRVGVGRATRAFVLA